jgi:plasmid stability protein
MPATSVMTVRIHPELLTALKARARQEGRSVSAEVVRLIRKELTTPPAKVGARTMGMFADFDAPDLEVFRSTRKAASRAVARRTRKYRKSG